MNPSASGSSREWVLRDPRGQELPIVLHAGDSATVGRDLGAQLPVLDAGVSRHHASISYDGQDLWLEDLHSQNGTFINAERIRRRRLRNGDVITFGRVSLVLTERQYKDDEDAFSFLDRLSRESLADLVRSARELASDGAAASPRRLLALAMEATGCARGALYLWDAERSLIRPVAAAPSEFFPETPRLVPPPLAETVFEGRKPRLLGGARAFDEGAGEWSSLGGSIRPPGAHGGAALVAPVVFRGRPLGLLYLERDQDDPGFSATDLAYVAALAWVSGPHLGEAGSPPEVSPDLRTPPRLVLPPLPDEPPALDPPAAPAAEAIREAAVAVSVPWKPAGETLAQLLGALEGFFSRTAALLTDRETTSDLEAPIAAYRRPSDLALASLQLCLRALRRLNEKAPGATVEVAVAATLEEAWRGLGMEGHLQAEGGFGGRAACSAADLELALRLALSALLLRAPHRREPLLAAAFEEGGSGRSILLRLHVLPPEATPGRQPEAGRADASGETGPWGETGSWGEMGASGPMGAREAARGEGKGERLAEDLCLRLACRLASERLGGALIVAEGVPALELELPNAAFRLRETPGLTGTPVRQSPAPSAG